MPVDSTPPDTIPADTLPPEPDGQMLDLSCAANQTPPTTADATITASGAANGLDIAGITPSITPLDGADLDVCIDDCLDQGEVLDSTTTAASPCGQAGCDFTTASISTAGAPLDAYLKVGKTGFVTTNIFPSEPIRTTLANVPALAMTTNAFATIASFAGPQDTGNGAMIVVVTDCALTPVEGAAVTITQGGNVVGNTPLDLGGVQAQLAGTFLIMNVPPGATTVAASVGGTDFRAHDVRVVADELTATQAKPGFAAP